MARKQRNVRLQTREARRQLEPSHEPYWHEVRRGLALGYRKGARGGSWWLREFKGGRRIKRDIGLADDDLDADGAFVLSWQQALMVALGEQRPTLTAPDAYTLEDALSAYWAVRRARSTAENVYKDQMRLAALPPELRRADVNDLNTLSSAALQRFRDSLVKPSDDLEIMRRQQDVANRNWTVLRAALNLAYDQGKAIAPERWRRIKQFRNVDRPRTRYLTVPEARRALNAMAPDFRTLAQGALYSGLRLGELLALRATDLDGKRVHVRHSKSGKARTVPLDAEGADFFETATAGKVGDALLFVKADGSTWNRMEVSRHMAAASTAGKITPPAKFHDLRRSYASLLINAGTDAEIIKELLGHSDLRMTLRSYAHIMQRTVAKAVEKNLPSFGFKRSNVRKLRP